MFTLSFLHLCEVASQLDPGYCRVFLIALPAMAANGSAFALTRAIFRGDTHPLDFGLRLGGERLLGPGKTWEGILVGSLAGLVAGAIIVIAARFAEIEYADGLPVYYGLPIGLAALAGDVIASFLKRRLGLPRGACAPLLDQLDFYAGGIAGAWALGYLEGVGLAPLLVIAGFVGGLHTGTNIISWLVGSKGEPC